MTANEASEDEILSDFRRLLEVSTQRANNVSVSTIPPVMDKPDRQALADSVNKRLPDLCSQTGAVLMSHEHNFQHADNSSNDLLLHYDGVHLSQADTLRLLQNLNVNSKEPHVGRKTSRPQTRQSLNSNRFDERRP